MININQSGPVIIADYWVSGPGHLSLGWPVDECVALPMDWPIIYRYEIPVSKEFDEGKHLPHSCVYIGT